MEQSHPRRADARFTGQSADLFRLALKTGALTILTFGIYRFWAKTRVRRHIWSSTELDGSRFEYTGTGLEKFLGFLLAVVILAVYIGLLQMILFFFGMTLFTEPESSDQAVAQVMALNLTFLAVVPLLLFATYRARRYKLARTRWRGIRFGMDNGAWGYAFRAMGYYLLAGLTLGILTPLATFKLEKYMADRTWFGDAKVQQHGDWPKLYRAMKHIFIGLLIMAISAGLGFLEMVGFAAFGFFVGYIWIIVGSVYYGVHSFIYLTKNKTLGEEIAFSAQPKTATIVLTYIVGVLAIGILTAIAFAILGLLVGLGSVFNMDGGFDIGFGQITIGAVGYFAIIVAAGAAWLSMVVQPIIAHYVDTFTVINADALAEIAQRSADDGADAEGFADALDIGGAI